LTIVPLAGLAVTKATRPAQDEDLPVENRTVDPTDAEEAIGRGTPIAVR
jgi:hypothetical protein